jgi:hypothetical protein
MRLPRSLRGYIPWLGRGGKGQGPGRENSLASLSVSLTSSLSHPPRMGAALPGVPITVS